MASFSDAQPYIDSVCNRFPMLSAMFSVETTPVWERYLNPYNDVLDILQIPHLNFLAAVIGGAEEVRQVEGQGPMIKVLTTLAHYLQEFTDLVTDKKFTDKLLNPDGLTFLNTMSELSLAYRLKTAGYIITFEVPFRQQGKQSDNDVDLKAVSSENKTYYFEVYDPAEMASDGFGDPLRQDRMAFKVQRKLSKKFGLGDLSGLAEGVVLLAVNTAHVDEFRIGSIVAPWHLNQELETFTQFLPSAVDGYVFFDDDFTGEFVFQGLFLRK
ncbi:hypothetical protein [Chitinophaga filiformis]|uniref:Uncharacterized protein n=1 Tax=Chitinophaga filiformis TaxID=104663 RepID=A0ABY4I7Q5_CHIFI|nr:hypothetical protein [Chitinophaga filiformis]UPK71394.1 hypothetical protein MYF79_08900 [Chitinophaga filiformis]